MQDERRRWSALIGLPRRGVDVGHRRLDVADRSDQ
jgi:hypothetical protein